ncbi:hypothetical protein [Albibacterium indicum]|uniref:hypothetical protein n=1 Tax=Albibacterium indicum TaxID=2292082 RepID=UPI000E51FF58|nr:hypothetical protein [Pedobacter indicus]
MDFITTILPAIVVVFLIIIQGYLTQQAMKNKYAKPLEKKVEDLELDMAKKDHEIKKLTETMLALQTELEKMAQDTINLLHQSPQKQAPKEEKPVLRDFYMSTPNKDGSFNSASYSERFLPSVSIYHFIPLNESEAEFEFESDEQGTRDALNFSQSYIEPVCDEENDVTPDSKKVVTLRKGLAEKTNGSWIVRQKAVVMYS